MVVMFPMRTVMPPPPLPQTLDMRLHFRSTLLSALGRRAVAARGTWMFGGMSGEAQGCYIDPFSWLEFSLVMREGGRDSAVRSTAFRLIVRRYRRPAYWKPLRGPLRASLLFVQTDEAVTESGGNEGRLMSQRKNLNAHLQRTKENTPVDKNNKKKKVH